MSPSPGLLADLRAAVGGDNVVTEPERLRVYECDGLTGHRAVPEVVVLPDSTAEVQAVVRLCQREHLPFVARGAGTGLSGGATPFAGGVVVALTRMNRILEVDVESQRVVVEPGVANLDVTRAVADAGFFFAPDPSSQQVCTVGGNVAENSGGAHCLKHGFTVHHVTGLTLVLPDGEAVELGGKALDPEGPDLLGVIVGSEGTLGIVTAAWLRLIPAPEVVLPVAAFHRDASSGCEAILRVVGSGIRATAIEFLDGETLACVSGSFDGGIPAEAGFMVIAEADGSAAEARRMQAELIEALGEAAVSVHAPADRSGIEALWRWRAGLAFAVLAKRGLALSEDIVVPVDRLEEAIEETYAIGRRHDVIALSFGHAGDGNLHSTFLFSPEIPEERERAFEASHELFDLAVRLGGSISGEHGLGYLKRGGLAKQWPARALELHEAVKLVFDPKGLFNPGKKLARLP